LAAAFHPGIKQFLLNFLEQTGREEVTHDDETVSVELFLLFGRKAVGKASTPRAGQRVRQLKATRVKAGGVQPRRSQDRVVREAFCASEQGKSPERDAPPLKSRPFNGRGLCFEVGRAHYLLRKRRGLCFHLCW
jgi:hypothetical protein